MFIASLRWLPVLDWKIIYSPIPPVVSRLKCLPYHWVYNTPFLNRLQGKILKNENFFAKKVGIPASIHCNILQLRYLR